MNRRVFGVIGLWVVTLAPTTVALSQTLADTAKAEQARRKKATPAGTPKIYTESDLPASLPKTQSELDAEKAAANSSARKTASGGAASAKPKTVVDDPGTYGPSLKTQIAAAEEEVQRLGKLPTGGGKVCRLPEGVFVPGVTAPEQVVCPYQMESRYDEAKRRLAELKSRSAAQSEPRRR